MKRNFSTMGMTATVNIADSNAREKDILEVFSYFDHIDKTFSTYIPKSEISKIQPKADEAQNIKITNREVKEVLKLSEKAKKTTNGYFDIYINGRLDPSGLVKGYAIHKSALMLKKKGYKNFYVEIAGDIEIVGKNEKNKHWKIGIENPFNNTEIIKVINLTNLGVATSGNYKQGQHIYNPMTKKTANEIMSITVIAKNAMDADILATACFAMGEKGIEFLEKINNAEGYMVKKDKTAMLTSGFEKYVFS